MTFARTTKRSKISVYSPSEHTKLWRVEGETRLPDCVMVELGTPIDVSSIDPELRGKCYVSGMEIQPIVYEKYQTLVAWKAVGKIERTDGKLLYPPKTAYQVKY